MSDIGVLGMEVYFPNTYVDQVDLEEYDGVSKGKYTIGLGQTKMAFASDREDVNTIAMTVVRQLMDNYQIAWSDIGRLEVGTETLIDKSKSTKTWLMDLFKKSGNHNIEGVTSINACYGGTNALFNTLNWMESKAWDGRLGLVVCCDLAVYAKGNARATGGAGAVCMLIGPDAPIVFETNIRSSYMDHQYDFYKPDPTSEYPMVDGALSQDAYLKALEMTYDGIKVKSTLAGSEKININDSDYFCFHSPYSKLVQKAFTRLYWADVKDNSIDASKELSDQIVQANCNINDKELNKVLTKETKALFKDKVEHALYLSKNCGNTYTGSIYFGLMSLLCDSSLDLVNKRIILFSYGSGCTASMFSVKVRSGYEVIKDVSDFNGRLNNRIKKTPEEYNVVMQKREDKYTKNMLTNPEAPIGELLAGTYYLEEIDNKWRRKYQRKAPIATSSVERDMSIPTISIKKSKLFALSKI
jgi:hydroxymethylglutaryl-CoA synthase